MPKIKYITYFRVSTAKQGQSGLGLEAQQTSVEAFTSNGPVIASYTEIETGTSKRKRPQLMKAIAHANRTNATLVVAKLDRLARSVSFVSSLLESGVDFIAADNPSANKLTIHILSAVAEAEAEAISSRTKLALAAAKARGVVLGNPQNMSEADRQRGRLMGAKAGAAAMKKKAKLAYSHIAEEMKAERDAGVTLQRIADRLNDQGERTTRGGLWSRVAVSRVLKRTNASFENRL